MENTPQNKADELVEKYYNTFKEPARHNQIQLCVQCAIITVDTVLDIYIKFPKHPQSKYWQSVKQILQSKIS